MNTPLRCCPAKYMGGSIYAVWMMGMLLGSLLLVWVVHPIADPLDSWRMLAVLLIFWITMAGYGRALWQGRRRAIRAELEAILHQQALLVDGWMALIVSSKGHLVIADATYTAYYATSKDPAISAVESMLLASAMPEADQQAVLRALAESQCASVRFVPVLPPSAELDPLLIDGLYHLTITPLDMHALEAALARAGHRMAELPGWSDSERYYSLTVQRRHSDMGVAEYDRIMDDVCLPICSLAEDGTIRYCNHVFAGYVGYAHHTLLHGPLFSSFTKPSQREANAPVQTEMLAEGMISLHNKNGTVLTAWVSQFVLKNEQQEAHSYYLLLPYAEDYLPLQRDPWMLLEQAPFAQLIIDGSGHIVKANTAFYHFVQWIYRGEPVDSFWNLLTPHDRASVEKVLTQPAPSPTERVLYAKPLEVQLQTTEPRVALLYISRMMHSANAPHYIVCLVDNTERKNLELRFVHSQKMQSVGQLAGGIAHDFNNLLTAMIGFCDLLLLRHRTGDPSFADIMQIKQNANRAANLVRQLLAFSRKQTLQMMVVDVTHTLADLSHLLGRLLGENIALDMHHARDLYPVRVDQGQLEQVITNLAVNARDAMGKHGTLSINTRNMVIDDAHALPATMAAPSDDEYITNGTYVRIDVTDTGPGIPKALLGQIFEPFFSTKEIGSGTGLGLSTVYGIVKQSGGYIYVECPPTGGATFSIFLPAVPAEEAHLARKPVAFGLESMDMPRVVDLTGKGTILLVEDEAPVRVFGANALTKKGYHVIEAESAEVALETMRTRGDEVDLIISDVIMPSMNGPSMVEEILRTYPTMPVIFISGYAEDALITHYREGESFHFLPKPFTLKQLATKVKDVMTRAGRLAPEAHGAIATNDMHMQGNNDDRETKGD